MVRIIDGEIVPDDDPRLSGPRGAPPSGSGMPRSGGGAAPAGGGGQASPGLFDWSAPPFRTVPEPEGQGLAGLPGIAVFGALITSHQLAMLAAAGLFFGLKGLLIGGIVWAVLASNRAAAAQQHAAATAQDQQQRVAAASEFFTRVMQQPPLGAHGARPGGGPDGSQGGPGRGTGQQGGGQDGWQGRGKAYKLSG